jgi:hypothetical protein
MRIQDRIDKYFFNTVLDPAFYADLLETYKLKYKAGLDSTYFAFPYYVKDRNEEKSRLYMIGVRLSDHTKRMHDMHSDGAFADYVHAISIAEKKEGEDLKTGEQDLEKLDNPPSSKEGVLTKVVVVENLEVALPSTLNSFIKKVVESGVSVILPKKVKITEKTIWEKTLEGVELVLPKTKDTLPTSLKEEESKVYKYTVVPGEAITSKEGKNKAMVIAKSHPDYKQTFKWYADERISFKSKLDKNKSWYVKAEEVGEKYIPIDAYHMKGVAPAGFWVKNVPKKKDDIMDNEIMDDNETTVEFPDPIITDSIIQQIVGKRFRITDADYNWITPTVQKIKNNEGLILQLVVAYYVTLVQGGVNEQQARNLMQQLFK